MSDTKASTKSLPHFNEPPHVMIVEGRFYDDVSDRLLLGTKEVLERAGATYEVYEVPGALEIPAAIQFAVRGLDFYTARKRFDAYIALGCVIRGETTHYEIVAGESARGLMEVSVRHTLCVGNGILTCETKEQAIKRADPAQSNKGGHAAMTALKMLELKSRFGIYPRS